MNWLCWHVGACVDPKLKLIARKVGAPLSNVIHAWAYHLERAAQGEPRGTFGVIDPDEAELDTEIPRPIWMAVVIALEERALIRDGQIVNFDKRNYGNSTLRVRAYRERQKRLKQDETLQIPNETLPVVPETLRNATGEERRGDKIINPKSADPVDKSVTNGHNHGPKNGVKIEVDPLRASRAFQGEKFSTEKKREKWIQNVSNYIFRTMDTERGVEIIDGFTRGDTHAIRKFEEASERMNAEKNAAAR